MGYIASPYSVHYEGVGEALYEGTRYANSIGKLPENLKSNTYERIKEIFSDYYNWDNILLYIYGDVDIRAILKMLDEEYLSKYEKPRTDLSKYDQEVAKGYRELSYPIPARADYEKQKGDAIISYTFDLGALDPTEYFALSILIAELEKDDGILDQVKEKYGIVGNIDASYSPLFARPALLFMLINTDEDQKDNFKAAIDDALMMVENGALDYSSLLSRAEIYKRNYSYLSSEGRAIESNSSLIKTARLYFDSLDGMKFYSDAFKLIESEDFITSIFKTIRDDDTLRALVVSSYEPGLYEEKLEDISNELDEMKESLSDAELEELVKETEDYYEWLLISRANEDIAISRESVDEAHLDQKVEKIELNGAEYTLIEIDDEKDILNFSISFPSSLFSGEDKNYLALYFTLLNSMDTEKHSHMELVELFLKYLYGNSRSLEVIDGEPYFTYEGYADKEDLEDAAALIFEVLESADFTKEDIERYLSEEAEDFNLRRVLLYPSSISSIIGMLSSPSGLYVLDMLHNGFYDYAEMVLDAIDDESFASNLISNLERVRDGLLKKGSVKVRIIANKEDMEDAVKVLDSHISALDDEESKEVEYIPLSLDSSMALLTNASTANLVYLIKIDENIGIKGEYLPYLLALANSELMSLRTGGGTYSVGVNTGLNSNASVMYTLSDSSPDKSLSTFISSFDSFKEKSMSEEDLNAASLSTLALLDMESFGAISKEIYKFDLLDLYGKERGENLLNGAKELSLREKDEAIDAYKEAFLNNGMLIYVGPENLFEGIKDHFDLVLNFR